MEIDLTPCDAFTQKFPEPRAPETMLGLGMAAEVRLVDADVKIVRPIASFYGCCYADLTPINFATHEYAVAKFNAMLASFCGALPKDARLHWRAMPEVSKQRNFETDETFWRAHCRINVMPALPA